MNKNMKTVKKKENWNKNFSRLESKLDFPTPHVQILYSFSIQEKSYLVNIMFILCVHIYIYIYIYISVGKVICNRYVIGYRLQGTLFKM